MTGRPLQRIGLSATQRPLEEIGRFVSGARPIELVDAGRAKELDLEVVVPLEDMRDLSGSQPIRRPEAVDGSYITDGAGPSTSSIWPSIYPRAAASSSSSTARRSCSSTTAAWPSASRCA